MPSKLRFVAATEVQLQGNALAGKRTLYKRLKFKTLRHGGRGDKKRSFFWDGGVEARRNRCCRHYSVDQLGDLNVVTALRCFSRKGVAISPGTLYAGQRSVGLLSVGSVSKM
jgi:hypothetical protein